MQQLANFLEQFFRGLFEAFTNESFAWNIAAGMTTVFVLIVATGLIWTLWLYFTGLLPALKVTSKALGKSSGDINKARISFAKSFEKVDRQLSKSGFGRQALSIAWLEFRESLFDTRLQTSEGEIKAKQNSIRPIEFFAAAIHPPRFLGFFANIFVGFGLLLTFIGLVAALGIASDALHDEAAETTAALVELITTASNKFVTSVFGVGCSLLLKLEERILTQVEVGSISRLSVNIERGLKFVSPQSLADETLFEARQQSASLRVMGETVATHIGEKLNAAITPLAVAVSELRQAFKDGAEEQARTLRETAGTAISDATGAELRALAQHLSSLGDTMNGLERKIQDSGSVATAQIANAAGELREALSSLPAALSKASESSADSFARLNAEAQNQMRTLLAEVSASIIANNERMNEALGNLPSMLAEASTSGARGFAQVNDEAQRQFASFFSEAGRRFEENNDRLQAALTSIPTQLSEASAETQRRMSALLEEAARTISQSNQQTNGDVSQLVVTLKNAVNGLPNQLQEITASQGRQITELSNITGVKLTEMLGRAADSLNESVGRLHASFSDLPTQLASAAAESRRIFNESAAATAQQLSETQAKISSTATLIAGLKPLIDGWQSGAERTTADMRSLVEASVRNQRAAEELTRSLDQRSREAAQQLSDVAGGIKNSAQASTDALAQARALQESITGSHQALMAAWESHRAKFDSVDEDLGRAAQLLNQAVDQFADKVATQISEMDRGLAKNISGLKDATDELAEAVQELNSSALKAAE